MNKTKLALVVGLAALMAPAAAGNVLDLEAPVLTQWIVGFHSTPAFAVGDSYEGNPVVAVDTDLNYIVVETLNPAGGMVVLGFRQFLVGPDPNANTPNATDQNGRFVALYIGSVAPIKQGRFDGCVQSYGPGKVVLHR